MFSNINQTKNENTAFTEVVDYCGLGFTNENKIL